MSLYRSILVCFLTLGLSMNVTAQKKPKIVKTELLTLSLNGDIPEYFFRNGKKIGRMQASRQGISPPFRYVGPSVLALYKNKKDLVPVKEGETPPKPDLVGKIATGSDRTLLIFAVANDGGSKPALKSYPIRDSSLGEGDYRIFNFARKAVYVALNGTKVGVKSGGQADIDGSGWGKEVQDIGAKFGVKAGQKIKPVYSAVWGHRPERRVFVFAFDRADKYRPLEIRKFYDLPSFKSAAPAAETVEIDG